MVKRLVAVACVVLLTAAACSDNNSSSSSSKKSGQGGGGVTVQVDNRSDAFNFESISYFPSKLTVAQGTTVTFHSNFQGEPHTVTFGSSIDKLLGVYDKLTPEQQHADGPPPPEVQALKIPLVFPDDADFSDIGGVKLNQSAAQGCVVAKGQFAPGADPCPTKTGGAFDGTQTFYNSGLLKDDATFQLPLADDLPPGTYQWMCLFHGPEMRGSITVVPKGDAKAQTAAQVAAAGDRELAKQVAAVQPAVDKATKDVKPGEVAAGAGSQDSPAGAIQFFPKNVSIPVGGTVKWNLSFHTVSFNAPEDAHLDINQDADGTWHMNAKTFAPVGYTPPKPPDGGGDSSGPPPALNVDGGTWDGSGYFSSGSIDNQGDVFFTLKFSKAGTYKYVCLIHPDMEGTVTVG